MQNKKWITWFQAGFVPVILLGIIGLAYAPLWDPLRNIDYDSQYVLNSIMGIIRGEDTFYQSSRPPGSAIYTLWSAFLVVRVREIFSDVSPLTVLLIQSNLLALLSVGLFYRYVRREGVSRICAGLIVLSLALHPMFFWHALSAIEDVFAMAFALMAVSLVRHPRWRFYGIVCFSVAVGAKFSSLGLLPVVLYEYVRGKDAGMSRLNLKSIARPTAQCAVLTFLLVLPAAANFGMDPARMFKTMPYDFSFLEKCGIAWFYIRTTINWWIPALCFVLFDVLADFGKDRKYVFLQKGNAVFIAVAIFALAPSFLVAPVFIAAVGALGIYYGKKRHISWKIGFYLIALVWCLLFACFSPYSRSMVFFALIPVLLILMARFKSLSFWVLMLFFSYAPMFHYFQLTLNQLLINKRGYYSAFWEQTHEDFNAYGFVIRGDRHIVNFLPFGDKAWNRLYKR